jgi:hypothetical protein
MAGQLDGFLGSITNSTYLDQLQEYSEPGSVIGRGSLVGGRIGPVNLAAGQTITDQSIQGALNQYITTGGIVAPDPNRLYFVFTPPNVHVQFGSENSFNTDPGFLGYHYSFTDSAGATVYYAVVVDQIGNYSIGSPYTPFQQFTEVASHELAEAITDPLPLTGWFDNSLGAAGEIGDLCNLDITNFDGYTVQKEWSNLEFAATGNSHFLLQSPQVMSFLMEGNGAVYQCNTDGTLWYRDPGGDWTLLDRNVVSFALGRDGTIYDLEMNGTLERFSTATDTWLGSLDRNPVVSMALGSDGTLYDLEANGTLERFSTTSDTWLGPLDRNVVSFALASNDTPWAGYLVDLHANGQLMATSGNGLHVIDTGITSFAFGPAGTNFFGDLFALGTGGTLYASTNSGWVPWDGGVTSFAFGGRGTALAGYLIDLHGNGTLDGNGGSGFVAWDTGVSSFVVGSGGYLDVLESSGNLWQYSSPSARSLLDQAVESIWLSDGGFTLNALQANGKVRYFTT